MMSDISFQSILEEIGYESRSYSGREMFGKTCLGVVVKGNVGKLIVDVIDYLTYISGDE